MQECADSALPAAWRPDGCTNAEAVVWGGGGIVDSVQSCTWLHLCVSVKANSFGFRVCGTGKDFSKSTNVAQHKYFGETFKGSL